MVRNVTKTKQQVWISIFSYISTSIGISAIGKIQNEIKVFALYIEYYTQSFQQFY